MSVIEAISMMSKSGYDDKELLEYIDKRYDEIECELNGNEYKEPKKHNRNFCIDCNMVKTIDYQNKNKTNNLILNLTPEKVTQHSRIERQLHTKEAQHPLK